jgi:hypothetical protein
MLGSPRPAGRSGGIVFSPALLLLAACFKPYGDLAELDFSEVAFENPHVAAEDALIATIDTAFTCPDGEPAQVFSVYRESWSGPRAAAVLLHSGPFDYVLEPKAGNPLGGTGLYGTSRLTRVWSVAKSWETLGVNPTPIDADESNSGALIAALVDAGVAVIIPGNCWGDLWHNVAGEVDNDLEIDLFQRDGLGLASATVRSLVDATLVSETGIQIPVDVDDEQLYLIGLGEGGRGVGELLARSDTPDIVGVLVDSSPDALSFWADDDTAFAEEADGLARIFGEDGLVDLDDNSLLTAIGGGQAPDRTAVIWSSIDPQLPAGMIAPTAAMAQGLPQSWVLNTTLPQHVQLNDDPVLAAIAANWLLTGELSDTSAE